MLFSMCCRDEDACMCCMSKLKSKRNAQSSSRASRVNVLAQPPLGPRPRRGAGGWGGSGGRTDSEKGAGGRETGRATFQDPCEGRAGLRDDGPESRSACVAASHRLPDQATPPRRLLARLLPSPARAWREAVRCAPDAVFPPPRLPAPRSHDQPASPSHHPCPLPPPAPESIQ